MGAGIVHTGDLDQFVAECDRLGGLNDPRIGDYFADCEIRHQTTVDQHLDPFSDDYFAQQCQLYVELAGRKLNQSDGELTPLDVPTHAAAVNPYNSRDLSFISKHTRAVLTSLLLANLPAGATILDAGCGWGLSSEMMAYCGASIVAIDINPMFVELVRTRAARLALPITAIHSGFDTYDTDARFDLLFFYECLHHSLKPWETLQRLGRFVRPSGKIVFAGEPVNAIWWKNWGLRLDPPSVYCMRKFGWWESGWSMPFLERCFAHAGFRLQSFDDIGLDNGPIGLAVREGQPVPVPLNEQMLEPMRRREQEHALREADMRRQIAELSQTLAGVRASRSWRLTRPLRWLSRRLGRH